MFKLKESNTFDWNVKARVPVDGKHQAVQFIATFNILSNEEILAFAQAEGDETGDMLMLRRALVSFRDLDVVDDDGEDIIDHARRNEIILNNPVFAPALIRAYADGIAGHKAKN